MFSLLGDNVFMHFHLKVLTFWSFCLGLEVCRERLSWLGFPFLLEATGGLLHRGLSCWTSPPAPELLRGLREKKKKENSPTLRGGS